MCLVIISRHVWPARVTRIMPIRALILSHYPPGPARSCDTNHAHPSSDTKSLSSKSGQLVWYGCMCLVIISRHVRPARMTRIMPIRALILSHYPPGPARSYDTDHAHPSSDTKSLSKSGQLVWYGWYVSCNNPKACPAGPYDALELLY